MKEQYINTYIDEIQHGLSNLSPSDVLQIVDILEQARTNGSSIFLIGNGGSAATASHFAHDLIKSTIREGKPRIRAIALTDNVPIVTAISNDHSYELIFVEQLAALSRPNDVLIIFSGSGNSENVVRASDWAKAHNLITVAFTGKTPNRLHGRVDACLSVPNTTMGQIEGLHLLVTQLIYKILLEV